MRVVIAAVGRLKQGAERELAGRFLKRSAQGGRAVGLREIELVEIRESRAAQADKRRLEESIAIASVVPEGATLVVLDEHGENLTSEKLAAMVRRWAYENRTVVFVIGGADGLAPALLDKAELGLAFGCATWPHQLVRIMLLEQLYRATTILSGHPYHRA